MCDTNHDAPLAEDLIISGSLQCIDPDKIATFNSRTGVEFVFKKYEPGMMATPATEKTEPDVTDKPTGTVEECKLACVTNFRASTWGGTTVNPAAVDRLHEEFMVWQQSHREEERVCNSMGSAVVYEIEDLVGHTWVKKPCGHYGIRYEIKWAGYEATTFEPLDNIPSNVVGCARVKAYNMTNMQHVCKYCGYQRAFSAASGLKRHETGCRHRAGRILST